VERTVRIPTAARAPLRGPKRLHALRTDSGLVDLVRAGNEAAFEVLYDRHVAGLLGFCRHMLGSQAEAEDAVQLAFISAHGAMRRGDRDITFKPWLYTIARNRCLSVLRARREQPSELPEISTAGLAAEVEQRAELRELVADVQRLPEHQRAALLLAELGDLSHAEVAEVIGVDPKSVKALVFRARTALAERRDARAADCGDIRLELAAATGGGLRRGRLRYHLESCPGCVAYLEETRRQRKLLGVALPVVPALALKDSVMSSLGIGAGSVAGGAAAAGGAAVGGGAAATAGGTAGVAAGGTALLGGTAAKVAIVGVLAVGAGGVATEVVRDRDGADVAPPGQQQDRGSDGDRQPGAGVAPAVSGSPAQAGGKSEGASRGSARGIERRARGQRIARERSGGRSAAGAPRGKALGKSGTPPGQARRGQGADPVKGRGRSGSAPGRLRQPAAPSQPRAVRRGQGGGPAVPPAPRVKEPSPQGPESAPPAAGGAVQPDPPGAKESVTTPHGG
jgi:RNA polymerase sigma factor (sigma-70 family)